MTSFRDDAVNGSALEWRASHHTLLLGCGESRPGFSEVGIVIYGSPIRCWGGFYVYMNVVTLLLASCYFLVCPL
jgi:hypothetical protein